MPTEKKAGWETELAMALWNKEKSNPVPGIKLTPQLSSLWPIQYINYAISALSGTCFH
jgi:hypothetical protein